MRKTAMILGILVATIATGLEVARARQEPGKRLGERLDDAAQAVKRGARDVGDAFKESFAKVKTGVHDMGVTSRVYSRLHWDRELHNSTIDVEVRDDGVAILKGSVPSALAKAKAVRLATDTVGVKSVEDLLGVIPSATIDASPVETKTTTTTTTPRP